MHPEDLMARYGDTLAEAEIIDAIEIAATRTLREVFGVPFAVQLSDTAKVVMIPRHGASMEINVSRIGKKLRRQIAYQIENELMTRQVLAEARQLKSLRGMVVPGVVKNISNTGNLLVEMELEDVYQRYILLGSCPVRYQPRHERSSYKPGEQKEWYVTAVLPVVCQRGSMVLIRLSRTSPCLPAILLRKHSGMDRIACTRRIPGAYSLIVTANRIPKSHINTVGRELREKLHVQIVH